jgi:hypothetical protein
LVDATGIPLAWTVTGGNRHDVTQLIPLIERVPPVRGRVGRPRQRPERLTADRSCCGAMVFADQSAESVAAFDLADFPVWVAAAGTGGCSASPR